MNLSKDALFTVSAASSAAATTAVTSSAAHAMAGYTNALFAASTNDATSGTVLTLTVYGVATNTTSGGTSLGSATYTSTGATDADDKLLIVDISKVTYAYVYATLTRTTQNCVVGGIFLIQYNGLKHPVTQSTSVLATTFAVSA